jgi:quercetin dioxygenase-like cupin family protein
MLVRSLDPARTKPVAMDGVKDVRMEILVGRGDGAPNFSMRHFVVEPCGHTPHHAHDYEHEVVILEGEAEVTHGDEKRKIGAGSALYIEANRMHQFRNVGASPLRFICMVPVSFDCGKPTPGS